MFGVALSPKCRGLSLARVVVALLEGLVLRPLSGDFRRRCVGEGGCLRPAQLQGAGISGWAIGLGAEPGRRRFSSFTG